MPPASADLATAWAFLEEGTCLRIGSVFLMVRRCLTEPIVDICILSGVDHIMTRWARWTSVCMLQLMILPIGLRRVCITRNICHFTRLRITIVRRHECMGLSIRACLVEEVGVLNSHEFSSSCSDHHPPFEIAGANLMGSDLYNHLIRYFNQHLVGLRDVCHI